MNGTQENTRSRWLWWVLLAVAVLSLMLWLAGRFATAGTWVEITVDGAVVDRLPLTAAGEYPLCGGHNRLVIENGRAYMCEATCPDRLCVEQGAVWRVGESIVCLPHRVVVTVCGDTASNAPDITI